MSDRVVIVGDGQVGLIMADALAFHGVSTCLWGPFPEDVERLRQTRQSHRLPGFTLNADVDVVVDPDEAMKGATLIAAGIPTQFLRKVFSGLVPVTPAGVPVVSLAKGVENRTLLRPTQIIAEALDGGEGSGGNVGGRSLAVLSGPTIAAELARRLPAIMVAASDDGELSARLQVLFTTPWLRIYTHDDAIGVELAGATKNVIALAAGLIDGLDIGYNAKSALLARGLAEITRLGVALGARRETFFGVAGVGDLATTCFSPEGRNRTCGERLGRGEALDDVLRSMVSVVEGVPTTQSVVELAARHSIEMPITQAINAILFEGLSPRRAIEELMGREPKAEVVG